MALRNTQTKVTDLLRTAAENAGLEMVDDRAFANTGTFRFQPKDSLDSALTIAYSFQDTYASFTVKPASIIGHGGELHAVRPEGLMAELVSPVTAVLAAMRVQA